MPDSAFPTRPRRTFWRLLVALSLPIAIVVYAVAFHLSVSDLQLNSRAYPQAAMVVLGLLLVGQVAEDVRTWLHTDDNRGCSDSWSRWQRTAFTLVWTLAFIWGMGNVGFYESLVIYIAGLLPLMGVRHPRTVLLFTAGTVIAMWVLFDLALSVRLPAGPILN